MPGPARVTDTELLRAVLAGAPVRIAAVDRDGHFLLDPDPNLPIASDSGAPAGKNFLALYADIPGVVEAVRAALAGEPRRITCEIGGATYIIAFTPRRNVVGQIDAVIAVGTVLSLETVVQRALAETQARERRLFHSNLTGLIYWDADGAVRDANDTFLELVGYSREELLAGGVSWYAITPPEYRHLDERALQEMRETGACVPFEKEYVRKDGQRVAVMIGAATWEVGGRTGVAYVIDISARKRHERERGEAEARLRRVVDGAPMVLWSIDGAGTFTLSMGRGLTAMGLSEGEVLGRSAFDVYASEPTVMAALRRGLAGEEFSNTMPVGTRMFDTLFTPLHDALGAVVGLVGVSIDVTERHHAEAQSEHLQAQLLQAQKLESLGLLAGGIAHDFNNILSVVLGGASTALSALAPDSPAREDIESVIVAAQRAAGLTHQMLAYAGKAQAQVRPIDLSTHIREIAGLLATAVSKKVELRLVLEPDLPAIEADAIQVQQVVMNLVINGAEAIGDQPGIVLVKSGLVALDGRAAADFPAGTFKPGRFVFLEVRDTGQGMDASTKARMFDPFFTTKFAGRGLGLAAVHGIVRAHGGGIRVDTSVGGGSIFTVFFPVSARSEQPKPRSPVLGFDGSGCVLLIDDDSAVRTTLGRMLKMFGFSVVEAADGRAGANLFVDRASQIVLALVDMTMPKMGGEETFHAIRACRADVPIILMSGYDELDATRKLVEQGRAAFLRKPFTPAELASKLTEAMRRK
jgi:PAS domain S-box-containing protein